MVVRWTQEQYLIMEKTLGELKFDQLKKRFFDGVIAPDRPPLPVAPLAIENLRNLRTLASYRVVPDEYGLNNKLTLNEQH